MKCFAVCAPNGSVEPNSSRLAVSLLALTALLGVVPLAVRAQDPDTTETALPDIAPREVEIRGQLEISFPSLQRQPLVGFNPPPRVPEVGDRRPWVEPYTRAVDLGTGRLERPDPPHSFTGTAYPPAQGDIGVSGGRYYSRAAHSLLTLPLADSIALHTRLTYDGWEGHQPFSRHPDVRSASDAAYGEARVVTTGSRWMTAVAARGFVEEYDLFGVAHNQRDTVSLVPERQGRGLGGMLQLHSLTARPFDLRANLGVDVVRYETRFPTLPTRAGGDPIALTERRIALDVGTTVPTSFGTVWVEGLASSGSLADDRGRSTSVDAGAGVRLPIAEGISIRAGLRFLGAFSEHTDLATNQTSDVRIGYVSPDLRLAFSPAPDVELYIKNSPHVLPHQLGDVFRENPYVVPLPELRPSLVSVDAATGGHVYAGPLKLAARAGYQVFPEHLYFELASEDDAQEAGNGFTILQYAEADIFHLGGSVSMLLADGFHAVLSTTYRQGTLRNEPEEEDTLPYFAPIVGEASISYSFGNRRGLLQLTGRYESARYVDRFETSKVGAFVDLDTRASYDLRRHVGLLARIDNLSFGKNERWLGYPQPPVMLGMGLRITW